MVTIIKYSTLTSFRLFVGVHLVDEALQTNKGLMALREAVFNRAMGVLVDMAGRKDMGGGFTGEGCWQWFASGGSYNPSRGRV